MEVAGGRPWRGCGQLPWSRALLTDSSRCGQGSTSAFLLPAQGHCGVILNLFSSVQSLSHVQLFVTPWTAAHQASLSITNSRSLCKLMSIELVMPSNHLILCCPLLLTSIFPSIRVFSSESALHIRWPNIGVSASTSVLPMNIQGGFPLEWTGLISLVSKGLSSVFSNTTV